MKGRFSNRRDIAFIFQRDKDHNFKIKLLAKNKNSKIKFNDDENNQKGNTKCYLSKLQHRTSAIF